MKKLVLMFVAIAAISFASCGNKTAEPVANADSDTAVVDSVVADTAVADSVVAEKLARTKGNGRLEHCSKRFFCSLSYFSTILSTITTSLSTIKPPK